MAAAQVAQAVNLIPNGNFARQGLEGVPENWAAHSWTTTVERFSIGSVRTVPGEAKGSRALDIFLRAGPGIYGCFSRAVDVTGLKTRNLLFSCRYRTERKPKSLEAPYCQAMLVSFNRDFMKSEWGTRPLRSEARLLRESSGWKTFTCHAELLPCVKQVVVVLQVMTEGRLLVQDVVVRPSPDEVQWQNLEVGRVTSLPDGRRATMRLTSHAPALLKVKVSLVPWREGRPQREVSQVVTLESGRPQEVDLRYSYPAREGHTADLWVLDAARGDPYLYQRVEAPGLVDAHLLVPAFRGTLVSTHATPEIVAAGTVFAVPAIQAQVKLTGHLLGTGAEATQGDGITRHEDGSFELRLPTEGMLMGPHEVRLEARVGRERVAAKSLPLFRAKPSTGEVIYDADRRLWASGKQMFPMGIYNVLTDQEVGEVAKAGFNFAVVPSPKASYVLAEAAAAKKVGLVISSPSERRDFWEAREQKFGANSTLLAWEIKSRPDEFLVHPDMMLALYQIVGEISPTHPVATILRYADTMSVYARATDIVIPWELPVPELGVARVGEVVEAAKAATGGQKPVWAVIQATGNAWATDSTMSEKAEGRLPTPAEVRAMAYLALIHGADGLLYYAYNIEQGAQQKSFRLARDAPELWACIAELNLQIGQLSLVLGGQAHAQALPPAADGLLHLGVWRAKGQLMAIAVNTSPLPTISSFSLPDCSARELAVMFEARKIGTDKPGCFGDAFPPYGVHVYSATVAE